MSAHNTLVAIRDLLSDPARWTKGTAARDDHDRAVNTHAPQAVCWCITGALERLCDDGDAGMFANDAIFRAANSLYLCGPIAVNDNIGHAAVLAVLDRAIVETAVPQ